LSIIFKYEVRRFPATRVIGRLVTHTIKAGAPNPVPGLWEAMSKDGSVNMLDRLPGKLPPERDTVGWMGEYDPATQGFTYIAGVLACPGTAVPEGYACRDVPECLMGIGWIRGRDEGEDLYYRAHEHTERVMKQAGLEVDEAAGGYSMEYYSYEHFGAPLAAGQKEIVLGYYLPCKPSQGQVALHSGMERIEFFPRTIA
jgi:hypothetical protein